MENSCAFCSRIGNFANCSKCDKHLCERCCKFYYTNLCPDCYKIRKPRKEVLVYSQSYDGTKAIAGLLSPTFC